MKANRKHEIEILVINKDMRIRGCACGEDITLPE